MNDTFLFNADVYKVVNPKRSLFISLPFKFHMALCISRKYSWLRIGNKVWHFPKENNL